MLGRRSIVSALVMVLTVILASGNLDANLVSLQVSGVGQNDNSTGIAAYEVVDFIAIDGNSDLLNQAAINGWPGSGSADSPVVISGYRIENSRHLLRVINTNLHFVFRNSHLDGIDGQWCGLYFNNVTNGDVVNVVVTNAAIGLHMVGIDNCTISNCTIFANDYQGVVLENACLFNTVSRNLIYENAMDGVLLDFYNQHNIVCNNTVTDNRQSGIYLYDDSSQNTVTGNLVRSNRVSGIRVNGDRSVVSGNDISEQTGSGVYIAGHNNTVSSNCIWNNTVYGVRLTFAASNNTIGNNTIAFSRLYGAALSSHTTNNSLAFNDFFANGIIRQAADDGQSNLFARNYWNPWNATDRDSDSVVDYPYPLDGQSASADGSPSVLPCNLIPSWLDYSPNLEDPGTDAAWNVTPLIGAALVVILVLAVVRRFSRT